jgi:AraC-like DNA-binding protein
MTPPQSRNPLSDFNVFSTGNVDEAEHLLASQLQPVQVTSVSKGYNSFNMALNVAPLGGSALIYNSYGARIGIDAGRIQEAFVLGITFRGKTNLVVDGDALCVSKSTAVVVSPDSRVSMNRSLDSGEMVLRVPADDLNRRFWELTGRAPRQPIVFEPAVDINRGPGARMRRAVDYVVKELTSDPSGLQNGAIRSAYNELLVNHLLYLPGQHSEELLVDKREGIAPGRVFRAEEYMRENYAERVDISTLVSLCECSGRALFNAFQDVRRYAPMEFLAEVRLNAARATLQNPSPESTVTSIAFDCGFTHPGRFGVNYGKRFGERPSETLRKARS